MPNNDLAVLPLNDLGVFAAVAEGEGFSPAARRLGVSKAMVSTAITRLEARLGVRLFHRTTRRVSLTEAGRPRCRTPSGRCWPRATRRRRRSRSARRRAGRVVCHSEFYRPSTTEGALIYLNANPDIQFILDRVESAGGKILVPKTQISPEFGFMAIIIDSEGNRVGLHSIE